MHFRNDFMSDYKFLKKNCFIDGVPWPRVYANKIAKMTLMLGSGKLNKSPFEPNAKHLAWA